MSLLDQQALNQVNGLAQALGLNQWQIQDAMWNGYKFAAIDTGVLSKLSSGLGQISTAISAANVIADSTKQAFGVDTNTVSVIPPGANMGLQNTTDVFSRKIAINSLPNGRDNIRSLGYNGQEIVLYGIDWGTNYLNGLKNNLINMFNSDKKILPTNPNYHILIHPFLGRIPNVWLLSMRIVHQATSWRACVYELRFRTETPIGELSISKSTFQTINDAISGILNVASELNNLWSSFDFVNTTNPQAKEFRNNVVIQNQIAAIQTSVLACTNNTVDATKSITTLLAPSGYTNVSLNKFTTTASTIPQVDYFDNHYTPQDINNLVNIIAANINVAIINVYTYGANYFYETLAGLKGLIASFSGYAKILLADYYGQIQNYTIPYDMNLFIACQLNNIDYETNYAKIIALNQGKFFWLNKLVKNDIIVLPIGLQ